MEKEWPSHKWTSDETNVFCEILADPVNFFMETLERGALKMHSAVFIFKLFIDIFQRHCSVKHAGKLVTHGKTVSVAKT